MAEVEEVAEVAEVEEVADSQKTVVTGLICNVIGTRHGRNHGKI